MISTKNFTALLIIISAIVQSWFLFNDNSLMVYILMLPIMIAARFHFEEQYKEKYKINNEVKKC